MKDVLAWCIVIVVSIANLYMGRAFAVWDLPRMVVARPSRKATAVAVVTLLAGAGLFSWNQKAQWYPFTLIHVGIISGAFIASYLFTRGRYGDGQPPVP